MILIFDHARGVHLGLARALRDRGEEVTVDLETDRGSMRAVRERVIGLRPSAIVVAGTIEDPQEGERDPDLVFRRAAEDLIHVAAAALEAKATAVLLSTAEVFGQSGGPFDEGDQPEPSCEWARSKKKGEEFLLRAAQSALVLRTGPILSDGLEHDRAMIAKGEAGLTEGEVCPIGVDDVAEAIVLLLAARAKGVYHLSTLEPPVRRKELALAVAAALSMPIELAASDPKKVAYAKLGKNPTLLSDKVRAHLKAPFMPWREALAKAAASSIVPSAARALEPGPQDALPAALEAALVRRERVWGSELIWADAPRYGGRLLLVRAGQRLSLHEDQSRDRTIYLRSGKAVLEIEGGVDKVMTAGDVQHVPAGAAHRLTALDDTEILEASAA